jgi:hypothetical protein
MIWQGRSMKLSLKLMGNMEDTNVYGKEDEAEDVPAANPEEKADDAE